MKRLPNAHIKRDVDVTFEDCCFVGCNRDGTTAVQFTEIKKGRLPEVTGINMTGWLCLAPYFKGRVGVRVKLALWLLGYRMTELPYTEEE